MSEEQKVTKKALGEAIFEKLLARRAKGEFDSNRVFRAEVLKAMFHEIGVSINSAATMYNQCRKKIEAVDPDIGLGRDPKKEVVKKAKAKPGPKPKVKIEPVEVPEPDKIAVES